VQRFGGFVAKYMGDGVLVYFGYPQAHEDDAERAVRAGLEPIAAVGGLKTRAPLKTRVGIATGLVVVGDLAVYRDGRPHEPNQRIDSPWGLVHATALPLTDSRNIPRSEEGGAGSAISGNTLGTSLLIQTAPDRIIISANCLR
jgi:hypothetical protein